MKTIALAAGLIALSTTARAVVETVQSSGGRVWAASSSPGPEAALSAAGPIAGNFHAFRGVFASKDLTCDQFLAEVHRLISDWDRYPHMNLYALTTCAPARDAKSSAEFIYGIDAWRSEAVPEVRAFLSSHQGRPFQGQTLRFSPVIKLDVKTVLALSLQKANGALSAVHSAQAWASYPGTDKWYPENYRRARLVGQTDLGVFLDWVSRDFGAGEEKPFSDALASANFVSFSDFFRLHLADGRTADFWLGFGGSRKCGAQPCFSKKPTQTPLDAFSARLGAAGALKVLAP